MTSPYNRIEYSFYDYKENLHDIVFRKAGSPVVTYNLKNGGGLTPVRLAHQGDDKNSWDEQIIQGQSLIINMVFPQADVEVVNSLIESEYKDWIVEYRINKGALEFIGYIKPENMYKGFDPNDPNIIMSLTCSDALADLQQIDFKDSEYRKIEGVYTIMQVIKMCLDKIGLELDFVVQLNTWETKWMLVDQCALSKISVNAKRFYEQASPQSEITYWKCWDVIESILRDFNVKFKQHKGKYYITNFHEKSSYSYAIDYNTLVAEARVTKNPIKNIDGRLMKAEPEQQKVHPLRSILTVVTNDDQGADLTVPEIDDFYQTWLVTASSFTVDFLDYQKNLVIYSNHANIPVDSVELRNPIDIQFQTPDDYIKLSFDFRIDYIDEDVAKIIKIEILKPSNGWVTARFVPLYMSEDRFISFESDTSDAFRIYETGQYKIRISLIPHPEGTANWNNAIFRMRNFHINKKLTADSAYDNPSYDKTVQQFNVKGYEEKKFPTTFEDGTQTNLLGSYLYYTGAIYELTEKWNAFNSGEDLKIIDLYSRNILMNRSKYKNFFRCTIIDRDHEFGLDDILELKGLFYVFASFDKDVRSGLIDCELIELVVGQLTDYIPPQEVSLKKAAIITSGTAELPTISTGLYQANHGFIVGDVIAFDKTTGLFSLAHLLDPDLRAIGIVSEVISVNRFLYINEGYFQDDTIEFVTGKYYYLDPENDGKMITTPTLLKWEVEHCIGFATHRGFKVEIDNKVGLYLSNFSVETAKSVSGEGTPVNPIVLVNDQTTVPANQYYGTNNVDNNRGYHSLEDSIRVLLDNAGGGLTGAIYNIVMDLMSGWKASYIVVSSADTIVQESVWSVTVEKMKFGNFKVTAVIHDTTTDVTWVLQNTMGFDYSGTPVTNDRPILTDVSLTLTLGVSGTNMLQATLANMPTNSKNIHFCFERCTQRINFNILPAGTGIFQLLGLAVVFKVQSLIQLDSGTFTLVGNRIGGYNTLNAETGIFLTNWLGFNVVAVIGGGTIQQITMNTTSTQFTTTFNLVVIKGRLQTQLGTFQLEGSSIITNLGHILSANVGTFVETGNNAEFTKPSAYTLAAISGTFIFSGITNSMVRSIKYGLLYNQYATSDSRKLSSSDSWVLPTMTQFNALITSLGGTSIAGGKMKEAGTTYWNSPNTGADNVSGFTARGAGLRNYTSGNAFFTLQKSESYIWVTAANNAYYFSYDSAAINVTNFANQNSGFSVRLVKTSTTLSNGQMSTYTGNDGKVYQTICINGVEWLMWNLAETKFRDGTTIPYYGANLSNYTNAEWAGLNSSAVCAYSNNWDNV